MPKAAALVGWKRSRSDTGIILTIQTAGSVEEARGHRHETLHLGLNDRQLRSLARDLTRAADERGLELFYRPRGWRGLAARLGLRLRPN